MAEHQFTVSIKVLAPCVPLDIRCRTPETGLTSTVPELPVIVACTCRQGRKPERIGCALIGIHPSGMGIRRHPSAFQLSAGMGGSSQLPCEFLPLGISRQMPARRTCIAGGRPVVKDSVTKVVFVIFCLRHISVKIPVHIIPGFACRNLGRVKDFRQPCEVFRHPALVTYPDCVVYLAVTRVCEGHGITAWLCMQLA